MNSLEPKKLNFNAILEGVNPAQEKIDKYEQEQAYYREQEKIKRYKESGVPEKFFNESLETYKAETEEEKRNKQTVENFAENPDNKILILCGRNGNGKTMLSCGILRNSGGIYILSSDMCVEYESATSYHASRTRHEILRFYSFIEGVLVIDECCKYFVNTELEKFILCYIICARYENNRATVLVTNGNKKEFIEFLGKSVFDRLTEVCSTLEFTEESKRKLYRK